MFTASKWTTKMEMATIYKIQRSFLIRFSYHNITLSLYILFIICIKKERFEEKLKI